MSYEVQKQIRDNSMELQDFLHDLTEWEHVVKEKEKKLVGSGSKIIPSVRGQKQSSLDEGTVNYDADQKIPRKAASHTYDYFRDKWDKFDVEAALAEVDEEPQPKKTSLNKGAGISKTKPVITKAKVERKPSKPNLNVSGSSTTTPRRVSSPASFGTLETLSSSYGLGDQPLPDAMSEKDLGNEYFKEGKYVKAIECYSRSIALEPTAVAFANRAMAFLKIRRYADAESDCTEAISLDDRYTKAYSRRGTARKELQKYFTAVEDFEFALRLEPENKELNKQYNEAKELYEKFTSKGKPTQNKVPILVEDLSVTSPGMSKSTELPSSKIPPRATTKSVERYDQSSAKPHASDTDSGASSARRLDERKPASSPTSNISPVATSSFSSFTASSQVSRNVPVNRKDPASSGLAYSLSSASSRPASTINARATPTVTVASQGASSANPRSSDDWAVATSRKMDASRPVDDPNPLPLSAQPAKNKVDSKLTAEVKAPSQATVERAAMNATAGLARNMVAPKTSYEFESTWKCFANDRQSQSRLLKIMEPASLPKIFKDLLSAPLFMDIMGCLPLLLPEHTGLVLRILENLVKVGRFDMTILFLTSKDKIVMRKLWEDLLATEELSINEETKLNALRSKYKL